MEVSDEIVCFLVDTISILVFPSEIRLFVQFSSFSSIYNSRWLHMHKMWIEVNCRKSPLLFSTVLLPCLIGYLIWTIPKLMIFLCKIYSPYSHIMMKYFMHLYLLPPAWAFYQVSEIIVSWLIDSVMKLYRITFLFKVSFFFSV